MAHGAAYYGVVREAAASASAAGPRDRSTSASRPRRPTSRGFVSSLAMPRKATRSRSTGTTSTCSWASRSPSRSRAAGPAQRPARRSGPRQTRLDPRAATAAEPDAGRPQGEGRTSRRSDWRRRSPRSARSSSGASRGPMTAAGGRRSSSEGRAGQPMPLADGCRQRGRPRRHRTVRDRRCDRGDPRRVRDAGLGTDRGADRAR